MKLIKIKRNEMCPIEEENRNYHKTYILRYTIEEKRFIIIARGVIEGSNWPNKVAKINK